MDEQMNQEDQIDIHPTGKTEQERICYSDDALTTLFNAHIALANNEYYHRSQNVPKPTV